MLYKFSLSSPFFLFQYSIECIMAAKQQIRKKNKKAKKTKRQHIWFHPERAKLSGFESKSVLYDGMVPAQLIAEALGSPLTFFKWSSLPEAKSIVWNMSQLQAMLQNYAERINMSLKLELLELN